MTRSLLSALFLTTLLGAAPARAQDSTTAPTPAADPPASTDTDETTSPSTDMPSTGTPEDDMGAKEKEMMKAMVQMEIDGLTGLITTMEKVIVHKKAKPTEEAKMAHQKGKALYQEAKALASAGDYPAAYAKLMDAWQAHDPANALFVSKAGMEVLEGVMTKLLTQVEERIQKIDSHLSSAPQAAKDSLASAKAHYEKAKTLHGADNDKEAFPQALEAIRDLHQTIRTAWKMSNQ